MAIIANKIYTWLSDKIKDFPLLWVILEVAWLLLAIYSTLHARDDNYLNVFLTLHEECL